MLMVAHIHLDLVGLDALIQGAHVLFRQIATVVDAPIVSQEILWSAGSAAVHNNRKTCDVQKDR